MTTTSAVEGCGCVFTIASCADYHPFFSSSNQAAPGESVSLMANQPPGNRRLLCDVVGGTLAAPFSHRNLLVSLTIARPSAVLSLASRGWPPRHCLLLIARRVRSSRLQVPMRSLSSARMRADLSAPGRSALRSAASSLGGCTSGATPGASSPGRGAAAAARARCSCARGRGRDGGRGRRRCSTSGTLAVAGSTCDAAASAPVMSRLIDRPRAEARIASLCSARSRARAPVDAAAGGSAAARPPPPPARRARRARRRSPRPPAPCPRASTAPPRRRAAEGRIVPVDRAVRVGVDLHEHRLELAPRRRVLAEHLAEDDRVFLEVERFRDVVRAVTPAAASGCCCCCRGFSAPSFGR